MTVPEGLPPGAPWAGLLWRHTAFPVTYLTALERITAEQCTQELLYAAVYAARTQ